MKAAIQYVATALPQQRLTNEELADAESGWTAAKIEATTGIAERRIAAAAETAADLATLAAENLFADGACERDDIDFVLLCSQSPATPLPTMACAIQHRLRLTTHCGAVDISLGSSGYVYALGLAKGLIETGQARQILLLTTDTYSKYIAPDDRNVRTIFGDGATATLVGATASHALDPLGPFVWGTDGSGAEHLSVDTESRLTMNGPEVFAFTLRVVPPMVEELLARSNTTPDDIDWFIFHQANQYMLERLRKKLNIAPERFVIALRDRGNTASSTIPLAIAQIQDDGRLKAGQRIMLVGFGGGLSWGATLAIWSPK